MADHDDIRSGLNNTAASIEVDDLEAARSDVHAVVRRRRRRTRVVSALGAVVAVAACTAVVVAVTGSDEPDTLMSADPAVVEDTSTTLVEPVDSTIADVPAGGARTVELINRPGVPGTSAGIDGSPETADWIVPWRDGFLVGSTVYPSQPLPAELPEDVTALFPQEVIDLFAGELPATIAEATQMLSEAGLLDEVTTVLQEHPEASKAIYSAPTPNDASVEARFTTDGITWEPVEMTLPPGATYTSGVAAVGDRLTIVYSVQDNGGVFAGTDRFTVATTTDLTTWTTQEVVVPPPPVDLPVGIRRNVSPQGLAVTESGWAVTVFDSVQPDPVEMFAPPASRRRRSIPRVASE